MCVCVVRASSFALFVPVAASESEFFLVRVTSAVSRRRRNDEPSTFRSGVFAKLNACVGHGYVADETLNALVCVCGDRRQQRNKVRITFRLQLHTSTTVSDPFEPVGTRPSRSDVAVAARRDDRTVCVAECPSADLRLTYYFARTRRRERRTGDCQSTSLLTGRDKRPTE